MRRLLTLSARPRGKWLVFGVWIVVVVAAVGFNLPGRFADNEQNESSSFLPGDVESTKALDVTKRLAGAETAATVIVYRRDSGLTARDRAAIRQDVRKLNDATRAFSNTTPFGNPADPRASEPFQLSRDGTTALVSNLIKATGSGQSSEILDPVDRYREVVGKGRPAGLQVKVAGPAGISADAIKVFANINGTLVLAALLLVIVLLIIVYRSPTFWFFPIFAVVVAEIGARALGWGLTEGGVTVNGQSSSILSVLVIGAGTDYALLLVARYREELRRHDDKHEAMELALRRAGPAILASGLTVMAALLSLSLAKVNGTAGLGPIGAMGIGVALLVMLTFLPAFLVIVGRRPFWPFVPYGPGAREGHGLGARLRAHEHAVDETHGFWRRVGDRVARRPRWVGAGGMLLLVLMALGLLNFSTGLTQSNSFRDSVESIQGQTLIGRAFPAGQATATDIVVPAEQRARVPAVGAAARRVSGVADVPARPVAAGAAGIQLAAFLQLDPYSTEAYDVIPRLRDAVRAAAPGTLVGGGTAVEYDLRQAAAADTRLLIPLALVIVFAILAVLLRAVVAPVLLIGTVLLSFLAALGVGALVFDVVFGFPGSDPSLPLFAFVFLVALGVDYNIFLMARVREETLRRGTREGMLRGLAVTGPVITSAGIVLAGTFAVLGVLPLTFLTEIGFVIAFGVLLDTFIVRSVIVPALVFAVGPRIWWPSALARGEGIPQGRPAGPVPAASDGGPRA